MSFIDEAQKLMKTQPYLLALWLVAGGMSLSRAQAQSSVQAAGGTATGIGGTVSYTVGLPAYTVANGPGGTVTTGPQQPFEILVLSAASPALATVECTVYPNPTVETLTLRVDEKLARGLTWRLTDLGGRRLLHQSITGALTPISLQKFAAGAYLLAVTNQVGESKTFKIIKH